MTENETTTQIYPDYFNQFQESKPYKKLQLASKSLLENSDSTRNTTQIDHTTHVTHHSIMQIDSDATSVDSVSLHYVSGSATPS